MTPDLARLAEVAAARARLDDQELELIDRARHAGATWAQVAAALGLGSRQAAEQRRQRLVGARRSQRRSLDQAYPSRVAALRGAVAELARWIDADRRWDGRFRRAPLVRATVANALDADPGSLHALASHVAADLAGTDPELLPGPVRSVGATLATLLSTDH
ncbi:hypothetical protein ACTMSW_11935 [Micromonospora sp. BQ11]|uniref:hypothetical protein n=1 Tax=Micromonospora sp. BQ11 TaxID=3452212 RepID=UPI003F8B7D2F